jgi:DNA sulfur modification protein DndE
VNEAISFDTYYEDVPAGREKDSVRTVLRDKTPLFRDFHISNIVCQGAKTAISITGLPEMPVQDIYFENMNISSVYGVQTDAASRIFFENVNILPTEGAVYDLKNSKAFQISHGNFPANATNFISATENVSGVRVKNTDLKNNPRAIVTGSGVNRKEIVVE